jgi:hypothetical protein
MGILVLYRQECNLLHLELTLYFTVQNYFMYEAKKKSSFIFHSLLQFHVVTSLPALPLLIPAVILPPGGLRLKATLF